MRRTFLLGVGCQKGGTTWLFEQLSRHPDVLAPPVKELHGFDTHFRLDLLPAFRLEQRRVLLAQRTPRAFLDHLRLYLARHDLRFYRRFFRSVARRGGPAWRVTMDITPAYAMLDGAQLTVARDLLRSEGYDVKVAFLMRDPVERLYSALRMHDRDGYGGDVKARDRFRSAYRSAPNEARTRYEWTLDAIDQAFPPEDQFLGFYEELFQPSQVDAVCEFLGLSSMAADFETRVNATEGQGHLDTGSIAEARAYYDETYKVCMRRFGEDRIRRLWANA